MSAAVPAPAPRTIAIVTGSKAPRASRVIGRVNMKQRIPIPVRTQPCHSNPSVCQISRAAFDDVDIPPVQSGIGRDRNRYNSLEKQPEQFAEERLRASLFTTDESKTRNKHAASSISYLSELSGRPNSGKCVQPRRPVAVR